MTRRKILTSIVLFVVVGFGLVSFTQAQSATEIMNKIDKASYVKTSSSEVVQMVISPGGEKRKFKLRQYSADGTDKGLIEYLAPNQVRGMKILMLNDGDDIWTYFPSTNRTRKIASSARNRKVVGSDFSYDDLAQGKFSENWNGRLEGIEKLNGKVCFKLELNPTDKGPQSYSKGLFWVDKSNYTIQRIEYFDEDREKVKRLDFTDYKKISGIWIPMKYIMTNLLDGGKTLVKVEKVAVNAKIDSSQFSEARLSQ